MHLAERDRKRNDREIKSQNYVMRNPYDKNFYK